MSMTGAVNDQASAYPAGAATCDRSGTASAHQGSAACSWCTSVPGCHPDAGVLVRSGRELVERCVGLSRPGRDPVLGERLVRVPQRSGDDGGRLQREVPGQDVHAVTLLGQPDGTGQPRHPGSDDDHSTHRASMAGRFTARENRRGPLSGRLRGPPERSPADGDAGADAQVRRLGAGALRRRLLQAAELDEPAVHRSGRARPRTGRSSGP